MKSIIDYTNKLKDFFAQKQALSDEVATRAELGAHNLLNIFESQLDVSGTLTATIGRDGSVTLDGTPTVAFALPNVVTGKFNGKLYNLKPNTKYVISYGITQTNSLKLQAFSKATSDGSWSKFAEASSANELEFTTPASFYDIWVRVLIDANTAVSSLTIYPSICLSTDKAKLFKAFVPTNEEIVDIISNINNKTGAHNRLPMSLDRIKALNTDGTWVGNVYSWRGIDYTIQTDSNGDVTGIVANGTATARGWCFISDYDFGVSINPDFAANPTTNGYTFVRTGDFIQDKRTIVLNSSSNKTYILVDVGQTVNNFLFEPLVVVSSDLSREFTPYAMTNRELTDAVQKSSGQGTAVVTAETGWDCSNVSVERFGSVVHIGGYATYNSDIPTAADKKIFALVDTSIAPKTNERVLSGCGTDAWATYLPCYLIIDTSGNITVRLPSGTTADVVNFNITYII